MFFTGLELIDTAVCIEENGEFFYRECAKAFLNTNGKNLFLFLAREDARHKDIFSNLSSSLKKLEIAMAAPHEEYPGEYFAYLQAFADSHVFTKKDTAYETAQSLITSKEILDFALQIELDSVLFYSEMKRSIYASQWPVLDQIIQEERSHYLKLSTLVEPFKNA